MGKKQSTRTAAYELYHSCDEVFDAAMDYARKGMSFKIQHAFLTRHYEHVHTFHLPVGESEDNLEQVFYKSQNLERSWRGANQCRSSSVGDVIKVGKEYWIVAREGFILGWSE